MTAKSADHDPIRHVVMLILENHSFDQMLGCCKPIYPALEGVDPNRPRQNVDDAGRAFVQAPTTERMMFPDPHHEVNHVAVQLADDNGGFVRDFSRSYPPPQSDATTCGYVMGYYPLDFLPALHALARDFTVCDHWFSSLPGPTWPNRFFALSGTSMGRVNMPGDGEHTVDAAGWFEQDQPTLFDRLNERGIRWKSYFHDIPQSSVLVRQRLPHNAARYFYIDEFYDDARGAEADFPQFALIEPDFMGGGENDDHPPHDVMKAEKLIADIYNAIRANPALWQSTLLLVFYDEHGGFYDHVVPPAAVPPDDHHAEYTFDRLGVRVPALIISPWADRGVEPTQFDHTSVLKYLIEKWRLEPLGRRASDATTTSIGIALRRTAPRTDTIARIELTQEQLNPISIEQEEEAWQVETAHHRALKALEAWIRIAVVENLWFGYAGLARIVEAFKTAVEWGLRRVYREPMQHQVSIVELDRVARKHVPLREHFGRFLAHQKIRSIAALDRLIRDRNLSEAARDQAVHTLSLVTNRRLHNTPRNVQTAELWLARHNR